uniref:Uncharacterized protein n=1 Tax=Ananas comosus var. bracteatus TaxID=296719 RepID=A0A6V7NGB7_ANACO|nr:unnamed protein product [Ananas comosus var. bracteatus]
MQHLSPSRDWRGRRKEAIRSIGRSGVGRGGGEIYLILPLHKMQRSSYASSSVGDIVAAAGSVSGGGGGGARTVRVIPLQHPSSSAPATPSPPLHARWAAKLRRMGAGEWLELLLPCSRWLRTYRWRECLQADVMAGVTVGVMLVPRCDLPLADLSISISISIPIEEEAGVNS